MGKQHGNKAQILSLPHDWAAPDVLPDLGKGIVGRRDDVGFRVIIQPTVNGDSHTLKLVIEKVPDGDPGLGWEDVYEFDEYIDAEDLPFGRRPVDVMSFITHDEGGIDNLGATMFAYLIECCSKLGWEEASLTAAKDVLADENELVFTLTLRGKQPYVGRVVLPWKKFASKYFVTRR